MQTSIVLTVAQSKRLIARAVAQLPEVRQAMISGTIAIGRGTTNGYVAEELLGHPIPKGEYVAGRTLPPGVPGEALGRGSHPDIVLTRGQVVSSATVIGAVHEMGPGDVVIKGGNALDYARQVVGVLVAHPEGGTIGGIYGTAVSRKVQVVIPIGLEKLVYEDIEALSRASRRNNAYPVANAVVSLFAFTGTIVTEIEALRVLCDVEAHLLAAGGVGGAEGAVWLLLEGSESALGRALALHAELAREPNLGLAGA